MNVLSENSIHSLFADYLKAKIEEGIFPKGTILPLNDFMMVFKLRHPEILKTCFLLEKDAKVRIIERSRVEVISGQYDDNSRALDVKEDIRRLFVRFGALENIAMENSWEIIDRKSLSSFFNSNLNDLPNSSQGLWLKIKVIHKHITEHCSDQNLKVNIGLLRRELDFFKLLYLDSISDRELVSYHLTVEALAKSIVNEDIQGARFQLLLQQSKFENKLLNMFKDRYILSCGKRVTVPNGTTRGIYRFFS